VALRSGKAAGVRLETSEVIEADAVVLAAGAATQALAAEAGVAAPVDDAPALLAWTEPVAPLLQGLVVGPGLELRQRADGRLLMAGDLQEDGPGASAMALIDRVGRALRGGESLRLDGFAAGGRPIPADGLPLAGEAAPGLWLAVTHSGATLAPALGAMLAAEIITAKRDPLLLPFDARRFGAA
jgi:glycine/D-amino acid oxidase-like deaminating enzyme